MKRRTPLAMIVAAALYLFVATSAYRFRHPWKTETELLLETPRALLWSVEPEPKE